jgi:hypothetical protein
MKLVGAATSLEGQPRLSADVNEFHLVDVIQFTREEGIKVPGVLARVERRQVRQPHPELMDALVNIPQNDDSNVSFVFMAGPPSLIGPLYPAAQRRSPSGGDRLVG